MRAVIAAPVPHAYNPTARAVSRPITSDSFTLCSAPSRPRRFAPPSRSARFGP